MTWPCILYPLLALLSCVVRGKRARQNSNGESESPWKMPLAISIPLEMMEPPVWFKISVVFQFSMLVLRKLVITGEILYNSSTLIIQSWGTLSKAFFIVYPGCAEVFGVGLAIFKNHFIN